MVVVMWRRDGRDGLGLFPTSLLHTRIACRLALPARHETWDLCLLLYCTYILCVCILAFGRRMGGTGTGSAHCHPHHTTHHPPCCCPCPTHTTFFPPPPFPSPTCLLSHYLPTHTCPQPSSCLPASLPDSVLLPAAPTYPSPTPHTFF